MAFTIGEGIKNLVENKPINEEQTQNIMREIMSGQTNDMLISSFLTALRMHGETPEIIAGAAKVMREFAAKINPKVSGHLVDTCGTGGDNAGTFNISTLSALVAAGAGVMIAKHGNRSVSSKCGSADMLEAMGVKVDLEPAQVEKIIQDIGIGFMFAPKFHPAMKFAMPVRKALGVRTIFNILGPLTNPATAGSHVLGVYDKNLVEPIAKVMASMGADRVFVVHSDPGIDEIVPISKVHICEVNKGQVNCYVKTAKDFQIAKCTMESVKGGTVEKNLTIAKDVLINKKASVHKKVVVVNAAYAIMAAGLAETYEDAVKKAEKSLNSGAALQKLEMLVKASGGNYSKFQELFPSK